MARLTTQKIAHSPAGITVREIHAGRTRHILWHPALLAARAAVVVYTNYLPPQRPYLLFTQTWDAKYGWCQWHHELYAIVDDFGDLVVVGSTARK